LDPREMTRRGNARSWPGRGESRDEMTCRGLKRDFAKNHEQIL
jgi:hypothetical protein